MDPLKQDSFVLFVCMIISWTEWTIYTIIWVTEFLLIKLNNLMRMEVSLIIVLWNMMLRADPDEGWEIETSSSFDGWMQQFIIHDATV